MEKLATLWCSVAHDAPTWPIHGHYACRVCGREYQVEWSNGRDGGRPKRAGLRVYDRAVAEVQAR